MRTGVTKSELVETALDRFLGSDSAGEDFAIVADRLVSLSDHIERIERDLRIVNEVVALHARFHLAVTPNLAASEQQMASVIGSERFEEFAAQVGRRVERGTSLLLETLDRRATMKTDRAASDLSSETHGANYRPSEPDRRPSDNTVERASEPNAAAREGGSIRTFPSQTDHTRHREPYRR
jgi:hypothetical protein